MPVLIVFFSSTRELYILEYYPPVSSAALGRQSARTTRSLSEANDGRFPNAKSRYIKDDILVEVLESQLGYVYARNLATDLWFAWLVGGTYVSPIETVSQTSTPM